MLLAVRELYFCRDVIRRDPAYFSAPRTILRRLAQVAPRAQKNTWRPPIFQETPDDDVTVSRDGADLGSRSEGNNSSSGLRPNAQKLENSSPRDPEGNSIHMRESNHEHSASNSIGHLLRNIHGEDPLSPEASILFHHQMAELRGILAANDPAKLLQSLWDFSRNTEFIARIPRSTFIELLRNLALHVDFLPLRWQYRILGPKHYRELSPSRKGFYAALNNNRQKIQEILQRRLQSGRKFGIGEYAAILNLARATWDGTSARLAMRQMLQDKLRPNLKGLNDYLEARCWADTLVPEERQSLRVIPLSAKLRQIYSERSTREGNMILGHKIAEGGIRWEVTLFVVKMIDDGLKPDAKTYVHLITAMAREGDITGIKDVLKRVWHVDVDAVLKGENKSIDIPAIRSDSSLYPTEDLLFTLAHSFGINNDLNTAVRLVDFFSKTFAIPISQVIWEELLEWAFVLTRPRNGFTGQDGAATGQLKPKVMQDMWDVIMNTTPKVTPSLHMYDKIIRHHWRECHFSETIKLLRESVTNFEENLSKSGPKDDLQSWVVSEEETLFGVRIGAETSKRVRERTEDILSYYMIHRWFKLILSNLRWNISGGGNARHHRLYHWPRRLVPNLTREFRRYRANSNFQYTIPKMGRVKLVEMAVRSDKHTATVVLAGRKQI